MLHQEAASWAVHRLLLHGAALEPSEEDREERYRYPIVSQMHALTFTGLEEICRKSDFRGMI